MCICFCAHIAERWLQRSIIVLKLQSNQNTHKRARGDTLHVLCHQSHFSFCYDSTTSHRHNKTLDRLKIRIILKCQKWQQTPGVALEPLVSRDGGKRSGWMKLHKSKGGSCSSDWQLNICVAYWSLIKIKEGERTKLNRHSVAAPKLPPAHGFQRKKKKTKKNPFKLG